MRKKEKIKDLVNLIIGGMWFIILQSISSEFNIPLEEHLPYVVCIWVLLVLGSVFSLNNMIDIFDKNGKEED